MKYLLPALSLLILLACAPKPAAPVQPSPPKSSNMGQAGTGNPFKLGPSASQGFSGRRVLHRAAIRDSSSRTGTIVVNLCVNRKGQVVSAEYSPKGSDTADEYLVRLALENARQWRFEKSKQRKQCGNVTYNFRNK